MGIVSSKCVRGIRALGRYFQGQLADQEQTSDPANPQQQNSMRQGLVSAMQQQQQLPVQHNRPPIPFSRASTSNGLGDPFGSLKSVTEAFNDDDQIPISVPEASLAAQPEADPPLAGESAIVVSTRVEYSSLPKGQTQNVFGLVTVQAASAPEPVPSAGPGANDEERQPMDIICVLDVSGSMRGAKISQVQDAVRFVVGQSTTKDRLGIVSFNNQARRDLRLRRMDDEGKDGANVATLRLQAGGGTFIASGLDMALSMMEQRRQRNKVSAILLLTDGQDSSTRSHIPALVARAQQAHCALYSFGFGADHDASLLSSIAEQAQTPFTFVEDTSAIREAFAGAVGGLCSVVAQRVELNIHARVDLSAVHTGFTLQRPSNRIATVSIPDMMAGEKRDILVELAVPAEGVGLGQTVLLETFAQYIDLRHNSLAQTAPVTMETVCVEEPQPEAEPDEEVCEQRNRVEVTRSLREASAQSDRAAFQDAQQTLDSAGSRLSSCKKTRANTALLEEIGDARQRMQSRSMWEGGGRAECSDAVQMHSMQRCTNLSSGKTSKSMYVTQRQSSWIESSRG